MKRVFARITIDFQIKSCKYDKSYYSGYYFAAFCKTYSTTHKHSRWEELIMHENSKHIEKRDVLKCTTSNKERFGISEVVIRNDKYLLLAILNFCLLVWFWYKFIEKVNPYEVIKLTL